MQLNRTRLLINRLRRQLFSHVRFVRIGLVLLTLLLLFVLVILIRKPIQKQISFFRQFSGSTLIDHLGVTNFLIMGIGGKGHTGSDLTDSIIFASVNRNTKNVTLISLPRDIWVTSIRAKINTAYHYGYEKDATQGGILLAKSAVSETINQPIDYIVILDFSTFEKLIDLLGGVDVVIDRSFTDNLYPISGKENDLCDGDPRYSCRYERLEFIQGSVHLDGATALKFVRSRYSLDEIEGTDFGRNARQEKVFLAIKSKILSADNLKHPRIYLDLYQLLSDSFTTDLSPSHYFSLAALFFNLRHSTVSTYALSQPDQLQNPPISPRYDNQWVLVPKDYNSGIVYDYVSKVLGTP